MIFKSLNVAFSEYRIFKHFLLDGSIKVLRKGQREPLNLEVYSTPSIEKWAGPHEIKLERRNHARAVSEFNQAS